MANVFVGFGCLGMLNLPNDMQQQQQQPQQSKDNDTLSYLVLVKDATSMGNVRTFDFMRINDVVLLPLNDSSFNNNSNSYSNYSQTYQGSSGGGGGGGGGVGGSGYGGLSQNTINSLNDIKYFLI